MKPAEDPALCLVLPTVSFALAQTTPGAVAIAEAATQPAVTATPRLHREPPTIRLDALRDDGRSWPSPRREADPLVVR